MKRLNLATLAAAATATAAGIAVASVASAVVATGAAILVVRAVRNRKQAAADPNAPRPVVLVTGGSRGLGLSIASRFAAGSASQRPARLILASRNMAELQQAQETLLAQYAHLQPEDFHLVAADLSKPEEAQRLINEAIDRFGPRIGFMKIHATVTNSEGEFLPGASIDKLATALLTTLQGGLLLTKTLRDPEPLETALSTMIDHIESLTIAKPRRS